MIFYAVILRDTQERSALGFYGHERDGFSKSGVRYAAGVLTDEFGTATEA
jgi:hypothetical protein